MDWYKKTPVASSTVLKYFRSPPEDPYGVFFFLVLAVVLAITLA